MYLPYIIPSPRRRGSSHLFQIPAGERARLLSTLVNRGSLIEAMSHVHGLVIDFNITAQQDMGNCQLQYSGG